MSTPVIFDLDGTLVDPYVGVTSSIKYALTCLDLEFPPEDTFGSFIGPPLRHKFSFLLGEARASEVERAVALYREHFAESGILGHTPYPWTRDLLLALQRCGTPLFVCTSKPQVFAEEVLRNCQLEEFFVRVYGPQFDGKLDHKSKLLKVLLEEENLGAKSPFMVGDRKYDIEAGKHNALVTVGVTWGYGDESELLEYGADHICRDMAQLRRLLGV